MSTMICSLWDGGQGDAQRDWYAAVAQRPGVVMDCGRWRTGRSKMGERAVEEEEKVTRNNAGAESEAQDDVQENGGKEWEVKGRLVEEQDGTWRRGGHVLSGWFVSTTHLLQDILRHPLLMCNSASLWRWVREDGGCLWRGVRGDWWFTEERWWVIHLHEPRRALWQHEWPVICHQTQRPSLVGTHSRCFSSSSICLHLTHLWVQDTAALLSVHHLFAFFHLTYHDVSLCFNYSNSSATAGLSRLSWQLSPTR